MTHKRARPGRGYTVNIVEMILKKKAGEALSPEEIRAFARGAADGCIPDYQLSALLMAICFQGMDARETTDLTMEMMHSGGVVDLSGIDGVCVDKHSTGGVGDTTTLVLVPLAAACGAKVAKLSGRGLGHTGGTLDKLESIPGCSIEKSQEAFIEQVKSIGCAVIGQTHDLCPADKALYALRDVTGTVDSVPLIASSIVSKKLASGAGAIVLDVKTGSGAFMEREEDAFTLAREMVSVGKLAGRNMAAVVTDMDQPLGYTVGNALEVREAIAVLRGEDVPDLKELCLTLGANILVRSGAEKDETAARARLERCIADGSALGRLAAMVKAQGGDERAVYDTSLLPLAPVQRTVAAPEDGYVTAIDAKGVGHVSMLLGGGRATKESAIDLSVGVVLRAKVGDRVQKGGELAVIHAADGESAARAEAELLGCYRFSAEMPQRPPFIRGVVS